MRLSTYTDYNLRVLIYLTVRYGSGEKSTIQEIADAYGISKAHLMKIVHQLSQHGIVETARGRSGGLWLARPPDRISVGEVVRLAESDIALVECHQEGREFDCAVSPACNLKRTFRRALGAFMRELDQVTLKDAVVMSRASASLLNDRGDAPSRRIPIAVVEAMAGAVAGARRRRRA